MGSSNADTTLNASVEDIATLLVMLHGLYFGSGSDSASRTNNASGNGGAIGDRFAGKDSLYRILSMLRDCRLLGAHVTVWRSAEILSQRTLHPKQQLNTNLRLHLLAHSNAGV